MVICGLQTVRQKNVSLTLDLHLPMTTFLLELPNLLYKKNSIDSLAIGGDQILPSSLQTIAYLEVDESDVKIYSIPMATDITGQVDKFRYPLAGEVNAKSSLCLVQFDSKDFALNSESSLKPLVKKLTPSISERFPWCEYVPRVGWLKDGRIWCQLLDRKQQKTVYVAFNLEEFYLPGATVTSQAKHDIFIDETSNRWINITNLFHSSSNGKILYASEVETGYRHLYLLDLATKTKTTITKGKWQIDDEFLKVDEARNLVYYMGTKDSPIEAHLYVSSLVNISDPEHNSQRLTPANCTNDVTVSNNFTQFVSVHSNITTPHKITVYSINHSEGHLPTSTAFSQIPTKVIPNTPLFPWQPGTLFNFKNTIGDTSYGIYYTPIHMEPNKKYPTLLYVYGGPHVQLVTNSYTLTVQHKRWQLLASEGYVVVIIDGVGSWRRGLEFEGAIQHKMGQVEIKDQILGLKFLSEKFGFIDENRIGVTGWSYGGYMSLCFLAQRSDFFKLAVAGGPVTLWEAYDTGYTERYMDTPQANETGYKNGNVLNMAHGFPKDENRLLIIHGLMDENVHFIHTSKLIGELVKHGKPYHLQVYPEERHGVRSYKGAVYMETRVLQFLKNFL